MKKSNFIALFFSLLFIQSASSADYYWFPSGYEVVHYPSAHAACVGAFGSSVGTLNVNIYAPAAAECTMTFANGNSQKKLVARKGDSCASGSTYNPLTGECVADPTCPAAGTNKLVAFTCDCSGKYCTNPSSFSFEGCGYEKNLSVGSPIYPPQRDMINPAQSSCMGILTSTGLPLAPSDTVGELVPENLNEPPVEGAEPSCVTTNAHEFCPDPDHPNCGIRDGNPYCFNETDSCGDFNGQLTCIPSSGGRTCSYVSGQYTCVDKATGNVISSTSSDHPSNGGNADGNDTNDAQAPGAVVTAGGGSAQGSDEGATNKAITDLQGALTDRLDGISDLLGEGEPTAKNINAPTETGSLDLDEWDEKIEQAKVELKQSSEGIGDLMNAANNWIITGSGGSLSCFVEDWGRMCLADYQDQLIGIRYVLIFMASILAIYIIFIRD